MAHVRATNVNHPIPESMANEKSVSRLLAKHEALENEIADMTAGLAVDWDGVKLVKKQKLMVAEQLEDLRRQLQ